MTEENKQNQQEVEPSKLNALLKPRKLKGGSVSLIIILVVLGRMGQSPLSLWEVISPNIIQFVLM